MRFRPLIRRIGMIPVLAAGFGLVLGGCGSSSPSSPGTSSGKGSGASSSSGNSSAESAIKANWVEFFAASTPVAKRVQLLQNGQEFAALITAQAKSPLASSASAKVSGVTGVTSSQATVKYSILAAGQTALPNQTGVAVFQGGTWKVGDASFCGLLRLEQATGLPAACSRAG
ncbi:MAG TPA: hypothetical protein VGI31_08170 [Streptosporangiaceae bacterium]|jgi:hypothetical protein